MTERRFPMLRLLQLNLFRQRYDCADRQEPIGRHAHITTPSQNPVRGTVDYLNAVYEELMKERQRAVGDDTTVFG